jgi:GDP-L-fucose synthase
MGKYRRILISGGTGLLGMGIHSIVSEYPESEFIFFGSRECDLTNLDDVLYFVDRHRPDAFIHTAALVGGIRFTSKYPASILRSNILMDINVLEAQRQCGIDKVILTLSTGMYAQNTPNPIKESSLHYGFPHASNYSYSFGKRLIDPLIKAYRQEYLSNVIGLIPNCIFGENMNYRTDESLVVAALIRRFYENRDNAESIVVWGDGTQLREYTYSRDMARAYMWCLDNYDSEQVLHIGSTEEYSIMYIAHAIADALGIDRKRIIFDDTKPNGVYRKSTDNSLFLEQSNFKYTPFKDGLNRTVQWFVENFNKPGIIRL